MTPKEKAEELYDKFYELGHLIETNYAKEHCKKCALICVEEVMSSSFIDSHVSKFFEQVKQEIHKL